MQNFPKKRMPITKRIIILPLVAVLVGILGLAASASMTLEASLKEQMKVNAINLAQSVSARTLDNEQALKTIDGGLKEKIAMVGWTITHQKEAISNENLRTIASNLGVGETNWFNQKGEIIFSTIDTYQGWQAPSYHPVRRFMALKTDLYLEDIRKDTESDTYNRYGYYRIPSGEFVQIGIPADAVHELTKRFSYQTLLSDIIKNEGVVFAAILDENLKMTRRADTDSEAFGTIESGALLDQVAVNRLQNGIVHSSVTPSGDVFVVYVPLMGSKGLNTVFSLAFSMESVNTAVKQNSLRIVAIGLLLLAIIAILLDYIQKNSIIKPIMALQNDLGAISIESDIRYRLPSDSSDAFDGPRQTVNHVLELTQAYFEHMVENQEELTAANEELEATIGQLTAGEEELRAQYDEIQEFAEKVENLKHRYAIAIEATESFIWEYRNQDQTISFSNNFSDIIGGVVDHQAIEDLMSRGVHPEDQALLREAIQSENVHLQLRFKDLSGQWRWYLMRGRVVKIRPSQEPILTGVMLDITTHKEQELYIQYLADHDPLTGLYSRRKFEQMVHGDLETHQEGAVLLMDVDNFKNINDSLGHVYGDKVLQHISNLLKEHLCDHGHVFRFGGDEFLIQLTGETDLNNITHCLSEIVDAFKNHCVIDGTEQLITISTGIARYPVDATTVEELLIKADVAMYSAKQSGKNQYRAFSQDMTLALSAKLKIEQILRQTLNTNGFMLYYQPVVFSDSSEIAYFEALIRMKDLSLSPVEFISIAEDTGLILEIGRWVITEAISQMRFWLDAGVCVKPIAINISPRQMYDPYLVTFIASQLRVYDVDASLIEVEITENILVENREENLRVLYDLKALGIKIALDDFGTGYSSLNYLTFIPVDKIKLDKSLKDKFIGLESIQVMDSLIGLAHGLQLKVVAEGVEEVAEVNRLKRGGCDFLQGYLFSKPLPAQKIQVLLREGLTLPHRETENKETIEIQKVETQEVG